MNRILILGAGRSSGALISYLLKEAGTHGWQVLVGDVSLESAQERIGGETAGRALHFDIQHEKNAEAVIAETDVVISLLPAHFHPQVAKYCYRLGKHLLTASYVSDEMKAFHEQALSKGLLFLNECGLDPGIDHMSAVQVMDKIRLRGGVLTSFESFTGGLIAPETDPDNPWRYKFTWNPRNVVMAGQGTARYLRDGQYKYIPYQQLFRRTTPVHVLGYGDFEGYANRDSLKYINTYNLQGIKTILRGTLRYKGYCSAWSILVQLGCCDDSYPLEGVGAMTHCDFLDSFLFTAEGVSVQEKISVMFGLDVNGPELERLRWSGLFTAEEVGLEKGTPAQVLEHILNKKWQLSPDDKDFVVMWHRFVFEQDGEVKEIQASLAVTGEDSLNTAMATTVGLPLGIAAKLLMQGKLKSRGVVIPIAPEFYNPILEELKQFGIFLTEAES
ncbi:MAG TPA: saccharopine dehydrogenase C-terminal domain-containing protein [Ohtaekwangia sp.]